MNNYWNMNIQYLKYASQTDSYLVLQQQQWIQCKSAR